MVDQSYASEIIKRYLKFLWHPFNLAIRNRQLEGGTWHTLRHIFASRLAMNGQSDSTIPERLRHSGTALVKRYAHLSPSDLKSAIEEPSNFEKKEAQMGRIKRPTTGEKASIEPV